MRITAEDKCYGPSGNLCGMCNGVHLRKFLKSYILVLIVENVIFFLPKAREIQEWQCYLGMLKCRKEGFVEFMCLLLLTCSFSFFLVFSFISFHLNTPLCNSGQKLILCFLSVRKITCKTKIIISALNLYKNLCN